MSHSSATLARHLGPMGRIVIFGGQGGGAIVAGYSPGVKSGGADIVGLLNDITDKGDHINGHTVLGTFASWPELPSDIMFLAPLHKAKEMQARAELIRRLAVPDVRWANLFDLRAAVAADAAIGGGSHIGPFAEVHPGARIGCHVGMRGGAKVSHDCIIGSFVFVGHNAVVCGYAEIGEGAHIAPQAVIRENGKIGRYAVVGLGAVVVDDVDDFAIVAGNPARRIGTVPVLEEIGA